MAPTPSDLYGNVIEWVTRQQQLALLGQPAMMTAAQRKALLDLHQLVKPREVEPEIGTPDWIGQLNQYRAGVEYTDEPVEDLPAPIRWIVYCRIAEHPDRFPGPAGGLDQATGKPPSFARKQSAKHYAAKCALEWLEENQYVDPASAKKQKTGGVGSEKVPEHLQQPPAANGGALVHHPGDRSKSCTSEDYARKQVMALCTELSLPPPRYHISSVGCAFEGFATFEGIAQHTFPPGGLGHVKQVLSQSLARELIAEEVRKELLKMKQEWDAQNAAIMGPDQ